MFKAFNYFVNYLFYFYFLIYLYLIVEEENRIQNQYFNSILDILDHPVYFLYFINSLASHFLTINLSLPTFWHIIGYSIYFYTYPEEVMKYKLAWTELQNILT